MIKKLRVMRQQPSAWNFKILYHLWYLIWRIKWLPFPPPQHCAPAIAQTLYSWKMAGHFWWTVFRSHWNHWIMNIVWITCPWPIYCHTFSPSLHYMKYSSFFKFIPAENCRPSLFNSFTYLMQIELACRQF